MRPMRSREALGPAATSPMPSGSPEPQRRPPGRAASHRRAWAVSAALIAVAGSGAALLLAASRPAPGYRLATASIGDVTQTISSTGTVQAAQQTTLSFATAGQIASVTASVGQRVVAGQTVATLNPASLDSQLAAAQAGLASAQARLASDEAAQATAASRSAALATQASQAQAAKQAVSAGRAALGAAEHADQNAQAELDKALGAEASCAGGGSLSGSAKPAQTAAPGSSGPATPTPAQGACSAQAAALEAAISAFQAASARLSAAQGALTQALGSYAAALGSASPAARGAQAQGSAAAPGPDAIAADQAGVAAAQVKLLQARQHSAEATLATPMAGVIAAVSMSPGEVVNGGSGPSAPHIVVTSPGSFDLTTALSASLAAEVHPGEAVKVLPDGSSIPIDGSVTSVGILPSQSTSASPTYPVTVSLPGASSLRPGMDASVSIVVAAARRVVAVPTSAVHTFGARSVVEELRGGKPRPVAVQLGARGAILTQVRSGLAPGTKVVLADLAAPLPTTATNFRALGGLRGPAARGAGGKKG